MNGQPKIKTKTFDVSDTSKFFRPGELVQTRLKYYSLDDATEVRTPLRYFVLLNKGVEPYSGHGDTVLVPMRIRTERGEEELGGRAYKANVPDIVREAAIVGQKLLLPFCHDQLDCGALMEVDSFERYIDYNDCCIALNNRPVLKISTGPLGRWIYRDMEISSIEKRTDYKTGAITFKYNPDLSSRPNKITISLEDRREDNTGVSESADALVIKLYEELVAHHCR